MPRKTEWTHRIGPALETLRASTSPWIDRAALEELLNVSPRQAVRILRSLSPHLAGKSLVIARPALIEQLAAIAQGEMVQSENRRLTRVSTELAGARRTAAARQVPVPVVAGQSGLPAGIHLEPGRLEITFSDSEELLGKLLLLARAMADDIDGFEAAITARNARPWPHS